MEQKDPSQILFDAREFVRNWYQLQGVSVLPDGQLVSPDRRTRSQLFESMYLDSTRMRRAFNTGRKGDFKAPVMDRVELQAAIDELVTMEQLRHLNDACDITRCRQPTLAPLRQFVQALRRTDDCDLDVAVMAHWLLNIKRKLNNKVTKWEMMPVLTGPQGAGKTWGLRHLFQPMSHYVGGLKLDQVTDARAARALSTYYIILFDEMAGVQRAEMESLKNLITTQSVNYRPLYSNAMEQLKNNSSFIGTSNHQLDVLLYDTTGMRRFFEIRCAQKIDFDAMDAIDPVAIWAGIDETRESYLDDVWEQLQVAQKESEATDEVKEFVEEFGLMVTDPDSVEAIETKILYGDFKQWCDQTGNTRRHCNYFGKKLSSLGIKSKKQRAQPVGYTRVYTVDVNGYKRLQQQFRRD